MSKKNPATKKLFDKYLMKMSPIKKEKQASELYDELKAGKNSYMRVDRLAVSSFDISWIKNIEDCLFDLGDIIKNPREVTKTEEVLVPVELARKTGSESVRHLASHTQYIKNISEEGDVIPNKILSLTSDSDIHTYENRFIATLVRRLVLFIEKRYEFIKAFIPLRDEKILYVKNKSTINGAEVEIETKVKITSDSEADISELSRKYISRVEEIRNYVLYYYNSQFMRKLKTDRDVRNPIIMTNILRKNPKYHKCYELYRFIERYQQLGVNFKVDEKVSNLNEKEMDELNTLSFTNYLALKDKDRSKVIKRSKQKVYKPKVLTSIDDEEFVYGDLLEGPFNFVRVDDEYQNYLESKVRKDLPQHPTKAEKEYYEDEYAKKKEVKEDRNQVDKLKKRKTKAQLEYEKKVKKIIEEREREAERLRKEEEERIRQAEEARINAIRQQIVDNALENKPEEPETPVEPVVEEEPLVEEPLEETAPIEEEPLAEAKEEELPDIEHTDVAPEELPVEEPTEEAVESEENIKPEEEVAEEENVPEEAPIEENNEEIVEETPVEEDTEPEEIIEEAPIEVEDDSIIEEIPTEEIPSEETAKSEALPEEESEPVESEEESAEVEESDEEVVVETPIDVPMVDVEPEEIPAETPVEEVEPEETTEEPIEVPVEKPEIDVSTKETPAEEVKEPKKIRGVPFKRGNKLGSENRKRYLKKGEFIKKEDSTKEKKIVKG